MAVVPDVALHGERAPDSPFLDSLRGTIEEAEGILSWTADREDVDETRIGAMGNSMGGAVTLALSCRELPLAPKVALMPSAPGDAHDVTPLPWTSSTAGARLINSAGRSHQ